MFICLNLNNIGYFLSLDFLFYCSQFLLQIFHVKSTYALTTEAIHMWLWAALIPNYLKVPKYALLYLASWFCSPCFLIRRPFAPLSARWTPTHLLRCRSCTTSSAFPRIHQGESDILSLGFTCSPSVSVSAPTAALHWLFTSPSSLTACKLWEGTAIHLISNVVPSA